jgi:signal transduction histidine kinase
VKPRSRRATKTRRYSRRELLAAGRVALVSTLLVAVAYAGVVAVLDAFVSAHLTSQVDRQLSARIDLARTNPLKAFGTAGVQSNGARYGLGIYGEPIDLWAFSPTGVLDKTAPLDPVLPAGTAPPGGHATVSFDQAIDNSTYRVQWQPAKGGFLLAAESLSELGHVEAVLVVSEAVAFPFLLFAFFLAALAIGLRSSRPVELARRRQLEFTADASHELRTPLSVIEAEIALARSQPRDAASYEATLDRVQTESGRLRAIVEDLLFLARADSEPGPEPLLAVDLRTVATTTAARFSPICSAKSQQLEVVCEGADPLFVSAPPEWIERLCSTLVDNASRYAGDRARIRIFALATGNGRIGIRVEDDGPGIPSERRSEVLGRFSRATTLSGGHGLGLAIAYSVARRTSGTLSIGTSELGGALVEASWPRAVNSRYSAPR